MIPTKTFADRVMSKVGMSNILQQNISTNEKNIFYYTFANEFNNWLKPTNTEQNSIMKEYNSGNVVQYQGNDTIPTITQDFNGFANITSVIPYNNGGWALPALKIMPLEQFNNMQQNKFIVTWPDSCAFVPNSKLIMLYPNGQVSVSYYRITGYTALDKISYDAQTDKFTPTNISFNEDDTYQTYYELFLSKRICDTMNKPFSQGLNESLKELKYQINQSKPILTMYNNNNDCFHVYDPNQYTRAYIRS
jgi:hypothetical protein